MKHTISGLTKVIPGISKIIHHPTYFSQKSFSNVPKRVEHETRFEDPTYDDTFKRLFGEEANKGLLINVLNNFLGFSGTKTIEEVEINNPALETRKVVGEMPSIKGAIDILCTTSSGQKIAVEMQGQKTKYFLAREQEYMAKLISGQIKEGEGALYHSKVLDTYIIVLAKKNLFVGKTALKDSSMYEVDVVPTVLQTQEIYPGNKMHWKFFELEKFAQHKDSENITKNSPLKLQWLDFLLNCAHQSDIPEDRDKVIQDGYHVMDKMSWQPDDRTTHWKNIRNEQEGEQLLADREAEGKAKQSADTLIELLNSGLTPEKIAKASGITVGQYNEIIAKEDKSLTTITEFLLESNNQFVQNDSLSDDLDCLGETPPEES